LASRKPRPRGDWEPPPLIDVPPDHAYLATWCGVSREQLTQYLKTADRGCKIMSAAGEYEGAFVFRTLATKLLEQALEQCLIDRKEYEALRSEFAMFTP
jgi:hypothetical protein